MSVLSLWGGGGSRPYAGVVLSSQLSFVYTIMLWGFLKKIFFFVRLQLVQMIYDGVLYSVSLSLYLQLKPLFFYLLASSSTFFE